MEAYVCSSQDYLLFWLASCEHKGPTFWGSCEGVNNATDEVHGLTKSDLDLCHLLDCFPRVSHQLHLINAVHL